MQQYGHCDPDPYLDHNTGCGLGSRYGADYSNGLKMWSRPEPRAPDQSGSELFFDHDNEGGGNVQCRSFIVAAEGEVPRQHQTRRLQ